MILNRGANRKLQEQAAPHKFVVDLAAADKEDPAEESSPSPRMKHHYYRS